MLGHMLNADLQPKPHGLVQRIVAELRHLFYMLTIGAIVFGASLWAWYMWFTPHVSGTTMIFCAAIVASILVICCYIKAPIDRNN